MIIILGLVILLAAVIVGLAGIFTNSGSTHALTHDFAVFGYHVTGSTGTLFLYGIVVGAIGLLGLDHPSWVEDDQFDIDRHIFRASLPQPRDRATLERIVGWMHAKLLNRARPLWEFYVFEGMKDNEIGLYSKMHHAGIDGGAGAALTNMIYDISPIPRKVDPPTAGASPDRSRAISPPTCSIPISSSSPSRSMPRRPRRTSNCRARARATSARSCSTTRCTRSRAR